MKRFPALREYGGLTPLILGVGATAALSLAYGVYAGRVLGPEEYSAFVASLSLVYLLVIPAGPLNNTVTRFTAHYAQEAEYGKIAALLSAVLRRATGIGLLFLLAALLVIDPLSRFLRVGYAPLLIVYGIVYLTVLLNVLRGGLRGLLSFGRYNVSLVGEAGLRLLVGAALLAVVTSAAAGVAAYLIALVAAILVAHVQLGRLLAGHTPEPVDRQAVMRFGVGSLLFAFAVASFQSVDMLLVKHYFSDHEAGLYGAALTVGRAIFLLVIPFRLVALPRLARREDSPGSHFSSLCGLYVGLAGPLLVALWLWPEQLLTGLLGIEYSGAEQVLPILAFAFFFGSLAVLLAQPLMAASDFRFLYLYVAALAGEIFFLATAHSSLTTIAVIVLGTQVFAAIGTGVFAWHGFRTMEVG